MTAPEIASARARAALETELLAAALERRRLSEECDELEAAFRAAAERSSAAAVAFAALDRERSSLHGLASTLHEQLAAALAERDALTARLQGTEEERTALRARLAEIEASRLWRLGTLYWRLLRALRILPRESAAPPAPASRAPAGPPRAVPPALPPAPAPLVPATVPEPIAAPPARPALGPEPAGAPPDIVCFSIVEWDYLKQRPQQILSRLADRGHRVYYVSQFFDPTPREPRLHPMRRRVRTLRLAGSTRHLFREEIPLAELDALLESLRAVREREGIASAVSVVHQPFWEPVAARAREAFGWPVLYDCMDLHGGFSTNERPVARAERTLVADADQLVVSSRALGDALRAQGREPILLPNGCDYEFFASARPRPRGLHPVIGFYGAIADWFDSDLVADLAERRPDWRFELYGPTYLADLTRLPRIANVTFGGLMPYGELVDRIDGMDVLILPFRPGPLTEAACPVKAFEIMAAGRSLVSVPLPELAPFGDLVRVAEGPDAFERRIAEALAEDAALVERRRAFARGHSWDVRAAEFERLLLELVVPEIRR